MFAGVKKKIILKEHRFIYSTMYIPTRLTYSKQNINYII